MYCGINLWGHLNGAGSRSLITEVAHIPVRRALVPRAHLDIFARLVLLRLQGVASAREVVPRVHAHRAEGAVRARVRVVPVRALVRLRRAVAALAFVRKVLHLGARFEVPAFFPRILEILMPVP